MTSTLHLGDCLEVMRTMPDCSVDAVVTDPPYGLAFMGKRWDYDVPSVAIWAECLRVLKPGGHLLAFAGTRTQHRMACRIEDAGFEIRDMIAWVYGSGFPKSLNVAAAIAKLAKPKAEPKADEVEFCQWLRDNSTLEAVSQTLGRRFWDCEVQIVNAATKERPVMARRALVPTAAKWQGFKEQHQGTIPPWIEELAKPEPQRAETPGEEWTPGKGNGTTGSGDWQGWGTALKPSWECITMARKPLAGTVAANVLEHGTGALNVDASRIKPTIAPGGREWEEQRNRAFLSAAIAALSDKLTELERCPSIAVEAAGPTTSAKAASPQPATCKPVTGCCDGMKAGSTSISSSIGEFGRMPTAQSLTDIASIIETASRPTIDWATWNSCQCQTTSAITSASITAALKILRLAASNSSSAGTAGRWPSNLIHDGSDEVVGLFPQNIKGQVGMSKTRGGHRFIKGDTESVQKFDYGHSDTGSAARFFYTAKASKEDREDGNTHPTVKPTDLMRYLCRLVTPPGGVVLDPFAGSGSTGKAAELEGFDSILIEQDPASYAIAKQRISRAQAAGHQPDLFAGVAA
jgi:DNA modification methylase